MASAREDAGQFDGANGGDTVPPAQQQLGGNEGEEAAGAAARRLGSPFRCGRWRRLSLKRVLFICLLLCTVSTLCILCLVVLSATMLNSQLDAEADMATMSARNVGENAIASLSTLIRKDFERTELFVRQTKPIFVDNALSVAADPMAALAAYNKTYCDLFFTRFLAGRGRGEQQGVTIAYNYDNFTRTQAFLLYTDVTRAKRVPLYSYTQRAARGRVRVLAAGSTPLRFQGADVPHKMPQSAMRRRNCWSRDGAIYCSVRCSSSQPKDSTCARPRLTEIRKSPS
jgi:hypothetical protein